MYLLLDILKRIVSFNKFSTENCIISNNLYKKLNITIKNLHLNLFIIKIPYKLKQKSLLKK